MSDTDPWVKLSPHSNLEYLTALMVGQGSNPAQLDISWTVSPFGQIGMMLVYDASENTRLAAPTFENIRIGENDKKHTLLIELLDQSMKSTFEKLCLDVIATLQSAPRSQLRQTTFLRLEEWSRFLKSARRVMSEEAQKGLIGELLFLKRYALSAYEGGEALKGWIGPEAGIHDFTYGQLGVEVKTKRLSGLSHVTISSEQQLTVNETEQLYLYVVEVNAAPRSVGRSLADYVNEVRELLISPLLQELFDTKLSEVGYSSLEDYSDFSWSEGRTAFYEVRDGFPRIDTQLVGPTISRVSYQIDLNACSEYLVSEDVVIAGLGDGNG